MFFKVKECGPSSEGDVLCKGKVGVDKNVKVMGNCGCVEDGLINVQR